MVEVAETKEERVWYAPNKQGNVVYKNMISRDANSFFIPPNPPNAGNKLLRSDIPFLNQLASSLLVKISTLKILNSEIFWSLQSRGQWIKDSSSKAGIFIQRCKTDRIETELWVISQNKNLIFLGDWVPKPKTKDGKLCDWV